MERSYKRWIFTKSTEFDPAGTLCLGQILAEPFDPAYVLQPGGPLSIPENIIQEDRALGEVSLSETNELSAQFGLWASLSAAPVGSSVGASQRRAQSQRWQFDSIDSKIMSPSLDYVQAALRHGDVPATLKGWYFKRRVYMITGVRVVHKARMEWVEEKSGDGQASLAADGTAQGVPASGGAKVTLVSKSSNSKRFESALDFVFAYRLNEVFYHGQASHRPFKNGETSSAGAPSGSPDEFEFDDFEVLDIDEDDYSADGTSNVKEITVPGFDDVSVIVTSQVTSPV